MKYYSEKLNEMFNSAEELLAAEGKIVKAKKKATAEPAPDKQAEPEVPTRKQLAAAVESADNAVKEAYVNYETAKTKAEELSKKYLEEINNIMEPAKTAVKNAEQQRYEAIRKFNDSYGAYQVTYTGTRAADELMKAISRMNSKQFRELFWF